MIPLMDRQSREFLDHIKKLGTRTLPPMATARTETSREVWRSPYLERISKEEEAAKSAPPPSGDGDDSLLKGLWNHFWNSPINWWWVVAAAAIAIVGLLLGVSKVYRW